MWKGNKSVGDNKVVFATEVYQEQTIAVAVSNTSGSNNSISCEMIRPNILKSPSEMSFFLNAGL